MPIGQRIETTATYLKHPPAASGWLADGDPLDAGTAHILHSNLSHLSEQNARLLGHALGPGAVGFNAAQNAQWTGIVDDAPQPGANIYASIPWDQPKTGLKLGPFPGALTRLGTDPPGYLVRRVRVVVECEKGAAAATTLRVMAAMSTSSATPRQAEPLAVASATYTDAAPGAKIADLTLAPTAPLRPTDDWICRAGTATEEATHRVVALWVWVGWHSDDPAQGDFIWSVSAFELVD